MHACRSFRTLIAELMVCALAGCAASEPAPDNGQTHWLKQCDSDADCGELSCVCRVCSTVCTRDSACRAHAEDAVCGSTDVLPSADRCDRDAAALSLCLPSGFGPNAQAGRPAEPPLTPAAWPLHVDCQAVETDTLPLGVERIATGEGWLSALAADGTALCWVDEAGLHHQSDPAAAPEVVLEFALDPIALEGAELFLRVERAIAKVMLEPRDVVNLANEAVLNIQALTTDESSVYWTSDQGAGNTGTATLWRSDRSPGTTEPLGNVTGDAPEHLAQLGDWLYFPVLAPEGEQAQLFRLRKDGGDVAEALGQPQPGLNDVVGDGTELFALVSSGGGPPGLPAGDHRVVRIEPSDGSLETLFETEKVAFYTLAIDATHIYWNANVSLDEPSTLALWRARRDGAGEPVPIAEGWQVGGPVAVNDTSIHFVIRCGANPDSHVLRVAVPGS